MRVVPLLFLLAACAPVGDDDDTAASEPTALLTEAWRNPVGLNPEQAGVADFDRNGHLDVVVANHGSNSISLLFGKGDMDFTVVEQSGDFDGPCGVRIADFNLDESPDVLLSNDLGNYVSVLLNSGAGSLVEGSVIPAGDDVCDMPSLRT